MDEGRPSFHSAFYHSTLTLTTLGYGSLLPRSVIGEVLILSQVLVGYVLFGLLVSVFAHKVSRRS